MTRERRRKTSVTYSVVVYIQSSTTHMDYFYSYIQQHCFLGSYFLVGGFYLDAIIASGMFVAIVRVRLRNQLLGVIFSKAARTFHNDGILHNCNFFFPRLFALLTMMTFFTLAKPRQGIISNDHSRECTHTLYKNNTNSTCRQWHTHYSASEIVLYALEETGRK